MNLLWLSNSNDDITRAGVASGARRPEIMATRLADALGEPINLVVKPMRPSPELPAILERRIREVETDIIWMNVANYWINYESTPLRVQRWLGRIGTGAAAAGFKVADRFGERRSYRGLRTLIQRTIGGDPRFRPEEVLECVAECARIALRDESLVLIIEGPRDRQRFYGSGRAGARMERRRLWLHQHLKELSGRLHCTYHGSDEPLRSQVRDLSFQKDAFHMDASAHARSADMDFGALLSAVQASRLR